MRKKKFIRICWIKWGDELPIDINDYPKGYRRPPKERLPQNFPMYVDADLTADGITQHVKEFLEEEWNCKISDFFWCDEHPGLEKVW